MVKDVYFLTVHEPYEIPGAPAPVNGVIVHALTFLHPGLSQPDARLLRVDAAGPGPSGRGAARCRPVRARPPSRRRVHVGLRHPRPVRTPEAAGRPTARGGRRPAAVAGRQPHLSPRRPRHHALPAARHLASRPPAGPPGAGWSAPVYA